jgi:hypothetical protein
MLARPRRSWTAAALMSLVIGTSATAAPSDRPWVDPPADTGVPTPQPAPDPPPAAPAPEAAPPPASPAPALPSARPQPEAVPELAAPPSQSVRRPDAPEQRASARMSAAREFAVEYLNSWSAPNPEALETAPGFYAPRVVFHGRLMSIRDLMQEKRRFAQRWPERRYRPLPDTMGVACEPGGDSCTVRSVFEFAAANPRRGRRSQGIATLELVLSFVGDRPVITAESSLVHGRGRGEHQLGLEGAPDG